MANKKIKIGSQLIAVNLSKKEDDYISLTDIARFKNVDDPRFAIQNWMKTRYTVDFLGIWEQIHNSKFNRVEFDTFKNEAGTKRKLLMSFLVFTPPKGRLSYVDICYFYNNLNKFKSQGLLL